MSQLNTINGTKIAQDIAESSGTLNPLQPVSDALERVFASTQEETRLQKTRRIMGDSVSNLSDEELEVYATEFQYLIDEWFDNFERRVFDGQTLKQVLGQE